MLPQIIHLPLKSQREQSLLQLNEFVCYENHKQEPKIAESAQGIPGRVMVHQKASKPVLMES